jgi:hypothetical protein
MIILRADLLVNKILLNISKLSGYSQNLDIKFETKNNWSGYIKLYLYPFKYADAKPNDIGWGKTDFSEIFLVEKEPMFLKWKEISFTYSDVHLSHLINLGCEEPFVPHRSHYSGHLFVSWWDYVRDIDYSLVKTLKEMEKNDMKEVPPMDENGNYKLKFDLSNMTS